MSDSIKKLQDIFTKFPTIGSRTAGRFVAYLIQQPKEKTEELITALKELKNNVKLCNFCFKSFENTNNDLCEICLSHNRNKQLLCIVEKEADLVSLENTKKFSGLYFILGNPLRLLELKKRIQTGQFIEIIIALNSTPDGRANSTLIMRSLKELPQFVTLKITRLGQGLPVGGELEYADEETLESAFEGRR